jgi:hypothetical protein
MTLEEFLKYIHSPVRHYGEYRVVAATRPSGKKRSAKELEIVPVTDVYSDDKGEDIILLTRDEQTHSAPTEESLTLKELNRRLKSLAKGRKQYSVECSSSKPGGRWRLDLPVCGSGVNETQKIFALLF